MKWWQELLAAVGKALAQWGVEKVTKPKPRREQSDAERMTRLDL